MEDDLYDEFGNYVGPDLDMNKSEGDSVLPFHSSFQDSEGEQINTQSKDWKRDMQSLQQAVSQVHIEQEDDDEEYYKKGHEIVLHEDKQYYPDVEKIYGKGVEALVGDEDAQPLTQPVIEPPKDFSFHSFEKEIPQTLFSWEYYGGLTSSARLIRNIAICGPLHHGKTLLCDMLIKQSHLLPDQKTELKWTDNRQDEKEREMSIKASPFSLILPTSAGKSYLFNFLDTPGHPNFGDEVTASMRLCDGVLLVVDCVEGVTLYTQRLIKEALKASMEIVVVLNKLDRLVLELKLPLNDAYHKIRHTLDEVNFYIQSFHKGLNKATTQGKYTFEQNQINPVNGNVIFASALFSTCFTLRSFAQKYSELQAPHQSTSYQRHSIDQRTNPFDPTQFASFLWGDIYYDEGTRKFTRQSKGPRSFVHFILEPFYKMISMTISHEKSELQPVLKKLGIFLNKKDFLLDIKPLLQLVLSRFFGDVSCIVDVAVGQFKDAAEGNKLKVRNYYRNASDDGEIAGKLEKCSASGPLCVNVTKLYTNEVGGNFFCLGRVISGTVQKGQEIKVLGEGFTLEEEEDMVVNKVTNLWIPECRYKVEIDKISAGNIILLGGVDESITKTATLTSTDQNLDIFLPLDFCTDPVVKVACEPLNPSELPKMLEGLRKIGKSYPLARTKVEQSGEHIVMGSGELYLDSVFHDLRKLYADIEIKVSEPFVAFAETVIDASSVKCVVESANKKNQLAMISEPLDKGLASYIESGQFDMLPNLLVNEFQWDELTAQSIWAFGPASKSTNLLIDYTLSGEVDKQRLFQVKESLIQGFQWSTREGPLCEEPIKSVKFKILSGSFASEPIQRGGSQIIPAARRLCYSSFLLAQPRIMEPYFIAEIACPHDCIEAIYNVLIRRRAHVTSEEPKPGSPLTILVVELPVVESFGFETDLRTHTLGQAMVLQQFSHWGIAPGDPLDKNIVIRPLEPSPVPHLAREFMVKSRRRKGLLEDVSIQKFFDSASMIEMAKQDPQLYAYF